MSSNGQESPKSCSACGCGCGGGAKRTLGGILALVAALIVLYVVGVAVFGTDAAPQPQAPAVPAVPAPVSGGDEDDGGLMLSSPSRGGKAVRVVLDAAGAVEVGRPFQVTSEGVGRPEITGGIPMLYVGPEKYNDQWRAKADAGDALALAEVKGHEEAEYPGYARFNFRVEEAGDYHFWIRAYWVDKCGNSVAVSVDDGPPLAITDSVFGRWRWSPLTGMNAKPVVLGLEAGEHTLVLLNREDDCYLDQMVFQRVGGAAPAGDARLAE